MLRNRFFLIAAVLAFVSLSAMHAKAGTDHFKVYLNNKLLFEQYLGRTFTLQQLELDRANVNDRLVFHYSHCGEIGRSRKIVVQDGKGRALREWKFPDVKGLQAGMEIPVKALLELKQEGLRIVYSAEQLPKGQALAGLRLKDGGTTGWLPAAAGWIVQVLSGGWPHAA